MNNKNKEVRQDIGLHIPESSLDVTYALMQQLVPGTYGMHRELFACKKKGN